MLPLSDTINMFFSYIQKGTGINPMPSFVIMRKEVLLQVRQEYL